MSYNIQNPSEIQSFFLENVNFKNGFYMEAGANDGVRDSISHMYEKLFNWRGILVEPVEEMMRKCVNSRAKDNCFIHGAIGDETKDIEIEVPLGNMDNASIVMSKAHREVLRKGGYLKKPTEHRKVKMFSYQSIVDDYDVKKIDLAIFDVEGFENIILKAIMKSNIRPNIMMVEKDWSDKNELIHIVKSRYKIIGEFKSDIIFKRRNEN